MYNYSRQVRYFDTDRMGVVHHACYLYYFEEGREALLENELGISYRQIEESGIMLPVVNAQCKYINGAKYGDLLTVETKITKFNGITLTFSYRIYLNDTIYVTGNTEHCFVGDDFKPIKLQKKDPALYEKIKSIVEL
ncbi:MAG TPA: acyl-CoA thioesterase [Lachnospiraceae bacterium]|nr:acyl-CoA thioesterase [Lachnospiraceae bacterium]